MFDFDTGPCTFSGPGIQPSDLEHLCVAFFPGPTTGVLLSFVVSTQPMFEEVIKIWILWS